MSVPHDAGLILLTLLQDNQFCPSQAYTSVNVEFLYQLAVKNKVEHLLLHFLKCELCFGLLDKPMVQKLEQLRFRLDALPLVFERERRQLERMLERRNVRAILFKQFGRKTRVGVDMDVLVSQKDLPVLIEEGVRCGYTKIARDRRKEVPLINPVNHFKIDVHYMLAAFPPYGEVNVQELQLIERYTSALFHVAERKRSGIVQIPIEWYVVSRMLHYWYNDMLCSLYPLYEISSFCYEHRHTIRWNTLFHIAETYSVQNEILLILSLANKILGIGLPPEVKKRVTFRIALASLAITLDDIVYFPPVGHWYQKKYREIAQKKFLKYYFLKLLVHQKVSVLRILRPRVLVFFASLFWRYLMSGRYIGRQGIVATI